MYYVYKITNLLNNRYYIGIHKTDNFSDNYMGSGKLIKLAIEKYGQENFIKEKLFEYETIEEALLKERELIDTTDPKTYNLHFGGKGGWDYVNTLNLENCMKNPVVVEKMKKSRYETYVSNKEYYDEFSKKNIAKAIEKRTGSKDSQSTKDKRVNSLKKFYENNVSPLKGKKKSEEHKRAMSLGWTDEKRNKKAEQQKQRILENPDVVVTNKGKKFSDETKAKMSVASKKRWEEKNTIKSTCIYCGKTGTAVNMKRWHFEHCKRKI